MSTQVDEFNVIQFEKRLTALKDSQENINACCKWCLDNRQHHKKIVTSWLNVLKRVKVEQRLTLFYLANDVIQYSKRKHYEFVESWGTALQKATTLVRDDRVKHKIVRIFNIWQQRGVYNEEFISDLCGLISVVSTAAKSDEPHEFQASYVINKIKQCSKLENETDSKLKVLKEHNPKIQLDTETLCVSLKDRAHVDDVEKEMETYVKHLEGYINALKAEIKCRIANISVLKQANNHLDKDKKDVKVVANAYKVFGNKVKTFQKKLEEHKSTLTSPIPSPDINAPSPEPDCDIELPEDNETQNSDKTVTEFNTPAQFSAGYYNPVPPPSADNTHGFVSNGYTSFIGSTFNVENLSMSRGFDANSTVKPSGLSEISSGNYSVNNDISSVLQSIAQPPPPPTETTPLSNFQFQSGSHLPLLPPPMPPFSAKADYDGSYQPYPNPEQGSYEAPPTAHTPFENCQMTSYSTNTSEYSAGSFDAPNGSNPYPPSSDPYNPEHELETWEPDPSWIPPSLDTDTPESPPVFEKEGYVEGAEYHDNVTVSGANDVDHRVLHTVTTGIENGRGRGKDVDHRNLISLTGSPAEINTNIPLQNSIWNQSLTDQDYRLDTPPTSMDQDYRLSPFNLEQLKLPPPPPPPKPTTLGNSSNNKELTSPPKKMQDNVESIDMDLSEDETDEARENLRLVHSANEGNNMSSLKPPPPLPDLPDDVDANSFLDDLDNDLNSNEFTANLEDPDHHGIPFDSRMNYPHGNMHPQNVNNVNNWAPKHQNMVQNFGFRGRGHRGGMMYPMRANSRGRGRGVYGMRSQNNFRSRGFARGPMRPFKARGGMRGNYLGGF